jgi:hypothetical protein
MKLFRLLAALSLVCLLSALPSITLAQEHGYWRAASKTASSVTGDISFSGDKITLNFVSFIIADIRTLTPAELAATFDDAPANATGTLYRTSIPGTRRFLHKNTLCGSEDTQWIVTSSARGSLQLAFFSGSAMPVLTPEARTTATDLCGIYNYVR